MLRRAASRRARAARTAGWRGAAGDRAAIRPGRSGERARRTPGEVVAPLAVGAVPVEATRSPARARRRRRLGEARPRRRRPRPSTPPSTTGPDAGEGGGDLVGGLADGDDGAERRRRRRRARARSRPLLRPPAMSTTESKAPTAAGWRAASVAFESSYQRTPSASPTSASAVGEAAEAPQRGGGRRRAVAPHRRGDGDGGEGVGEVVREAARQLVDGDEALEPSRRPSSVAVGDAPVGAGASAAETTTGVRPARPRRWRGDDRVVGVGDGDVVGALALPRCGPWPPRRRRASGGRRGGRGRSSARRRPGARSARSAASRNDDASTTKTSSAGSSIAVDERHVGVAGATAATPEATQHRGRRASVTVVLPSVPVMATRGRSSHRGREVELGAHRHAGRARPAANGGVRLGQARARARARDGAAARAGRARSSSGASTSVDAEVGRRRARTASRRAGRRRRRRRRRAGTRAAGDRPGRSRPSPTSTARAARLSHRRCRSPRAGWPTKSA